MQAFGNVAGNGSRQPISMRYYLWADDGAWRLSNRLHRDLIDKRQTRLVA